MTVFNRLDDRTLAAAQIGPADITAAAAQGIACIICNRPDGEDPAQPPADEVRQWAAAAGLAFVHLPVTGQTLTAETGAAMARALDEAGGPVLAYCKSGGRSTALWALASAMSGRHAPDRILDQATAAGYDISGLAQALAALSRG